MAFTFSKRHAAEANAASHPSLWTTEAADAELSRDERASDAGGFVFSLIMFALPFATVFFGSGWAAGNLSIPVLVAALAVGALCAMTFHIAFDWQRVVVTRFGAFNRIAGPGLYVTIPIIEQKTMSVDMRIRTTPILAEETLTSDLVPLDVNAALFWMVYNPQAACTEVRNFAASVDMAAQAALRDAIGRASVAEVAMRRNQLDSELKRVLEEQAEPWGVQIVDVKIRDILVPKELQDVMSAEAQAEQQRKARVTLMEAEQDVFDLIGDISAEHGNDENALRIRAMHLLYESVSKTGGTVVVPSSFSEGFGDVLPDDAKKAAEALKKLG